MEVLKKYSWPGNVRELVNTLENSITAAGNEPTIYAKHLPLEIRIHMKALALERLQKHTGENISVEDRSRQLPKMNMFVDNAKRQYLQDLMRQTDGNVRRACEVSGLSKSTFYDQLKKYAIPKPGKIR